MRVAPLNICLPLVMTSRRLLAARIPFISLSISQYDDRHSKLAVENHINSTQRNCVSATLFLELGAYLFVVYFYEA